METPESSNVENKDRLYEVQLPKGSDKGRMLGFHCPGCKGGHAVLVEGTKEPQWTWNGSMESPTFQPSLLVNKMDMDSRCHSFIKDGKIQFLDDCFHELAGKTVDIPEYE